MQHKFLQAKKKYAPPQKCKSIFLQNTTKMRQNIIWTKTEKNDKTKKLDKKETQTIKINKTILEIKK